MMNCWGISLPTFVSGNKYYTPALYYNRSFFELFHLEALGNALPVFYTLAVIGTGDWDADETDLLRKDTDKNGFFCGG